jgi:hypothetical protein
MYLVRVYFTNKHNSSFHWDFQFETDDYAEAIGEALSIFRSGLTTEELKDKAKLDFMAHPERLPFSRGGEYEAFRINRIDQIDQTYQVEEGT